MGRVALICHYRIGSTDGVSLEIAKRADVMRELGWKVYFLGGAGSNGADFIIPEMDFDRIDVRKITNYSFGHLDSSYDETSLIEDINTLAEKILAQLVEIVEKVCPDRIFIHNIFSHGRHIASAFAFYTLLEKTGITALATHHDFYWEREDFRTPSCPGVKSYMKKYIPPKLSNLKHAVISSRAAELLKERTGIKAEVVPDTLDFSMPPWERDGFNSDFPVAFDLRENDIVILQATRVVRRKGIELIIPVLEELNRGEITRQFIGTELYNGKIFTKDSRFVYLLAGYAEKEAEEYFSSIIGELETRGVPYRNIQPRIAAERSVTKDGEKVYSLFDTYVFADIISYPSMYEGWGNQFIEAVFAMKPIVAFEYPVFKTDIKPKGYRYISLGSKFTKDIETNLCKLPEDSVDGICKSILDTLFSNQTAALLKENFTIGKKYNSREVLKKSMQRILN